MMQLSSLVNDHSAITSGTKKVFCLKSATYPLLFARACASYCAQLLSVPCTAQSMQTSQQAAAMAGLQTSFLGSASCYWLGSLDELSANKQKEWLSFLKTYQGPHYLIFFSSTAIGSKAHSSIETIVLPPTVTAASFRLIAHICGARPLSFQAQLCKQIDKVSLDEIYLLMKYDAVVGKKSGDFAHDWLPEIIVPETSLFSLSQALFDRKPSSFFRLWKQLMHTYPAPFWVSFWAEQIWRAYCYVRFQKMGKQAEAKKIGYRLPFSFLNRSWRNYTLKELQALHHFLYEIDYHIKNGGSMYVLDLFYTTVMHPTSSAALAE